MANRRTCYAPIFGPSSWYSCLVQAIIYSLVIAVLAFFAWIPRIRCLILQLAFRIQHCGRGNSYAYIDLLSRPDSWLAAQPAIAAAIVWRAPYGAVTGTPKPYPSWTVAERLELEDTVGRMRGGAFPGLSATPPVTLTLNNAGQVYATRLAPDLAWRYYLAYVAQSLVAEIDGLVSWSMTGYSADELALLLDSRWLFEYSSVNGDYGILKMRDPDFNHGTATPGDPVRTFDFLKSSGHLGPTPLETVNRVVDWCRANLVHFRGAEDPVNLQKHWQYDGYPPVERIISGTTHQDYPEMGVRHWTAGCWGTTGFLRAVLRTANIPTRLEPRGLLGNRHALPAFVHEGRYLSHGDDPYSTYSKATPPFPASELLIDQAKFDAWFGSGVAESDAANNIGRRVYELAVQYLPDMLLRAHCRDLAAGKPHATSEVYDLLKRHYSVAELEATNLWTRLDAKVASFGGCSNIP